MVKLFSILIVALIAGCGARTDVPESNVGGAGGSPSASGGGGNTFKNGTSSSTDCSTVVNSSSSDGSSVSSGSGLDCDFNPDPSAPQCALDQILCNVEIEDRCSSNFSCVWQGPPCAANDGCSYNGFCLIK